VERKKILHRYVVNILLMCLLLSGCRVPSPETGSEEQPRTETMVSTTVAAELPQTEPVTEPAETEPEETLPPETRPQRTVEKLTVAVYPFIPKVWLFQEILVEKWAELEPDVALEMEHWDSYAGPTDCDVLMYDAVVLSYLAENGLIHPIAPEEMEDPMGILPFALDGAFHKGRYYGMPFFACGEFMIYYKTDTEMEKVENVARLASVAKERREKNPNTGVAVYSGNNSAYQYLDAMIDMRGEYSLYEQLPDCTKLDPQILKYVNNLKTSAVWMPPAKLSSTSVEKLFSQGYGFAYFGYSEGMNDMEGIVDKLAIKKLSYTENINIPLFYLDIVSVASHVTDPEKLELCKELMNLVASEEFLKEICFANGEAQYLLPARENVYLAAAEEYSMYSQLHELVMDPGNRAYRAGADFYTYVKQFP